jgi:transporter family-2 protein
LVAQLTIAVIIDTLGWFGFATNPLTVNNMIGLGLMMMGIFVFKLKINPAKKNHREVDMCTREG